MIDILEMEQALIGHAMSGRDEYLFVSSLVGAARFSEKNQMVWETINGLVNTSKAVDGNTVVATLERNGQLLDAGGRSYIREMSLAGFALNQETAQSYAKEVVGEDMRRRIEDLGLELAAAARNAKSPDELRLHATQSVFALAGNDVGRNAYRGVDEIMREREALIDERIASPVRTEGISTGYKQLDYLLGGWKPGFHIVAGRPSMGKTAVMVSDVLRVAKMGRKVAVVSVEMLEKDITDRMLSQLSGVPSRAFSVGWFMSPDKKTILVKDHPDIVKKMKTALEELKSLKIKINTHPMPTSTDVRLGLMRVISTFGADIMFGDHIHLMKAHDAPKQASQNMVAMNTFISGSLKSIAKDLQIPTVWLAQLSRDPQPTPVPGEEGKGKKVDRRPTLDRLRESGAYEQDAQTVQFVYRDDYYRRNQPNFSPTNQLERIVAKNQLGGEVGTAYFYYINETTAIYELDRQSNSPVLSYNY